MKKILFDPLLHFLVAGGVFYFVSTYWLDPAVDQNNQILVSIEQQQHLADLFELTWQRQPNSTELENLVAEFIKEEIYYREALALGLDRNDTIVRRRLRQKLEFVQEDLANLASPTDEQLRQYYQSNRDVYQVPRMLSYQQILIAKDRLAPSNDFINKTVEKLANGDAPNTLSLSSLLPRSMNLESEATASNTFGVDFVEQLSGLQKGVWVGPVYSSFGTHLLKLSLDQASHPKEFSAARDQVERDYVRARRELSAEDFYQSLSAKYEIEIQVSE